VEGVVGSAVDGLPGISIEFREILTASPMRQLPGSERLVSALQGAAREAMETEILTEGAPLYTDAACTVKPVCRP